ncbi:MAG: hypothetical protein U0169_06495 [Polyangiaceae bacterium]
MKPRASFIRYVTHASLAVAALAATACGAADTDSGSGDDPVTQKVEDALRRSKGGSATPATTPGRPAADPPAVTMAIPEDGCTPVPADDGGTSVTLAIPEEGSWPTDDGGTATTLAVGEEAGIDAGGGDDTRVTTFAVGEECGGQMTTAAVGEEVGCPS